MMRCRHLKHLIRKAQAGSTSAFVYECALHKVECTPSMAILPNVRACHACGDNTGRLVTDPNVIRQLRRQLDGCKGCGDN